MSGGDRTRHVLLGRLASSSLPHLRACFPHLIISPRFGILDRNPNLFAGAGWGPDVEQGWCLPPHVANFYTFYRPEIECSYPIIQEQNLRP